MDYQDKPVIEQREYLDPRDHRAQHLQDFLKKISMLESSGGLNTDHQQINSGVQAGDKAIGTYGLMPNTLLEIAKRYPSDVTKGLNKEELQISAIADPKFEETMAGSLADYLKNKRGLSDTEAAVAWESGHNTPVANIDINSPRAMKFKVLSGTTRNLGSIRE
jgi:hypothetical protein